MNKEILMFDFLKVIYDRGLITKFIKNLFNYNEINDYNYIFRLMNLQNEVIIDIYDNFSINRYNRYVFSFDNDDYEIKVNKEGFVYVKYISIFNVKNLDDKLLKFAYLFSLNSDDMVEYASSFLDSEFVEILLCIIK